MIDIKTESRHEIIRKVIQRILTLNTKAREQGLLSLEDDIDKEGLKQRDVFDIGLLLAIDGIDRDIVKQILDNYCDNEKYEFMQLLNRIKKAGALSIQCGENTKLLTIVLDSLIPSEFRTPELEELVDKYMSVCSRNMKDYTVEPPFASIPDRQVQMAMRNFETSELAMIISYEPKIAPLIYRNMSQVAGEAVKDALEFLNGVTEDFKKKRYDMFIEDCNSTLILAQ